MIKKSFEDLMRSQNWNGVSALQNKEMPVIDFMKLII